MPIFSVVARDYSDGLPRRLAARDRHIALGDELVAQGRLVFGAAILEDGQMKGSILIGKFADRAEVNAWLLVEPYVVEKVWERWTVDEIKVGPSFAGNFPALA